MTNPQLCRTVAALADYAREKGLIQPDDHTWAVNRLLEALEEDSFSPPDQPFSAPLADILDALTTHAVEKGLCGDDITSRDLFDTRLMGLLTPRPSLVIGEFQARYRRSPREATGWYYTFSQDTNYIRRDRVAKDRKWLSPTPYGELIITINLSKPEKDPDRKSVV